MTLINIDPKEFGLEESKASNIAQQFKPMLDKMVELESEFNEIIKLDIEAPETSKLARELRLKYVKVRTGTAEIHKQQKAFYLAGGKYVDGWKNAQLFASEGIEKKLEAIEKFYENKEKERIANLQREREDILRPFEVENLETLKLGEMNDMVFEMFRNGAENNFNGRKEAERLAEEDRLAKIKAEAEAIEAQRLENEKLRLANQEIEAEKARIKAELDAKLLAEAKAKAEEEAKAKAELLAAKKAAKAPDKEKMIALVKSLTISEVSLKEQESIDLMNDIIAKHEAFKNWALNLINNQ